MRGERDWINTYRGAKFWPCDPDPEEIDIHDVAHALSLQCRFTGHVKWFYSVAEHSVRVAEKCPPEDRLWGLLHDAAEAYLVDLARPVKHQPAMWAYRDAEYKLMSAVCTRFQLHPEQPASVTEADHRMLVTEASCLMNHHPDWLRDWPYQPYEEVIHPMNPFEAERRFLGLFETLYVPRYQQPAA